MRPPWRKVWRFLRKADIEFLHDQPSHLWMHIQKNLQQDLEEVFAWPRSRGRSHPNAPGQTDGIRCSGVLSHLKKEGNWIQVTPWMNFEDTVLNGISQPQEGKYRVIPLT